MTGDILRILRLAAPVTVARAGLLLMIAVDTAMSGRAGAADLAFYGIANAAHLVLVLIGVGLLQGTTILTAQAYGAGSHLECGAFWRIGLIHAVLLGVLLGALMLGAESFFRAIGEPEDLARESGAVMVAFSWGLPGLLMFSATSFFLEAINRPTPGMLVMLGANLANAGLNWVFIYGHWGLPVMGAEGAAMTTSIVRWLMLGALAGYVLVMPESERYGVRRALLDGWEKARKLRKLGYPISVAYGLEAAALSAVIMMAGLVGIVAAAGYQIAMNLLALVYMVTIGIATAASVRTGNAVGRKDRPGLARAGWLACAVVTVAMLLIAVPFLTASEALAAIYSDDGAVLELAAPLIAIAGLALVFDGLQGVLMGALRGAANVWVPLAIQLGSYWGIAVPLAYGLTFALEQGIEGLMLGLLAGFFAAAVGLAARFFVVSRRPVAPF